jgi:hypothetical protein
MTLERSLPGARRLLARILDEPNLAEQIQALPAPVLGRLVDRVGLEDAGEIVALATTEQLARVFDDDLWQSDGPGQDPRFDAERFTLWLEVLLEAGDAFVAARLAELPEDFLTLAFHRQVLVLDLATQMATLGRRDAEMADKALSSRLCEDLDEFLVVSKRTDGWDAVLAALLALDRDHHHLVTGILERCCTLSADDIDDAGGLYEVLSSEEMLEEDVAAARADRRAEEGFVAPSSAAAFLALARRGGGTAERDPLTRAWFRELVPRRPAPARGTGLAAVVEESQPLLLTAHAGEPLLVVALRRLAEEGDPAFDARSEELAYLANVLAAGCSLEGRRMRPVEATRAAIAFVSRGLELEVRGARAATELLRTRQADGLFRAAWAHRGAGNELSLSDLDSPSSCPTPRRGRTGTSATPRASGRRGRARA